MSVPNVFIIEFQVKALVILLALSRSTENAKKMSDIGSQAKLISIVSKGDKTPVIDKHTSDTWKTTNY